MQNRPQHHHKPFTKATYERNAGIYRILSNPTRLEILNMLKDVRELSVEDLLEATKVKKANLSQHLGIMKLARLVKMRKEGQKAYYSIWDPRIVEPCRILRDIWNGS